MSVAPNAGNDTEPVVQALPEGTRLLHIGIPKTGTTNLQRAAAYHREQLLQHGVCYPGKTLNHREQISALMSRPLGWRNAGESTPQLKLWNSIEREIAGSDASRFLISHEFACESTDEQAQRFRDSLGDQLHVVITLRGFADLLGSSWQQYVKAGYQKPYGQWLKAVLGPRSKLKTTPTFYKRNDQAAIVDRWIRVVGRDNVTVVIADKRKPDQLINAFEDLLAAPRGLLASLPVGGYAANRSLSYPEAEMIRRLNKVFREEHMTWDRYSDLMRHGFIARLQENRRPAPGEPLLTLPAWAARKALIIAQQYAEAIDASGCRVIGDLSALTTPVRTVPKLERQTQVPMDAVFEGVAGLLSAEDGKGGFFDRPPEGVQGGRSYTGYLRKLYDSEDGRAVANAVRATKHLDDRVIAGVAAYRGVTKADKQTKPYRRTARKLIKKVRRRIRSKLA